MSEGLWLCWFCKSVLSRGFICHRCSKIQPLAGQLDYFELFGQTRRLNIDEAWLEKKFHELSWKYHPDYHQGESEEERTISLENSASVNQAYRILRDPVQRIQYLIGLELGSSELKGETAPPGLFDEIIQIQEALGELKMMKGSPDGEEKERLVNDLRAAREGLEGRLAAMDEKLKGLCDEWDRTLSGENGAKIEILKELQAILSNQNYLRTVLRDIGREL